MKLSPESEKYADTYAFNKSRKIYEESRQELSNRKFVNFHETEQADFSIRARATAKMIEVRLESYILAYEKEGKLIDDEDRKEIFDKINRIIEIQKAEVFSGSQGTITMVRNQWSEEYVSQMKEYFDSRVRHLMEPALNDFILKVREMKLNKSFPQTQDASNTFHIGTFNGNFQQGVIHNMNKDFVLEKDRKRYEVLRWIYDEFNRTGNSFVNLDDLIQDGWETDMKREKERELIEISSYLSGEGLVGRKNDTGMLIMLTHQGIKEIENSIRNPQTPTEHFSVPVIQTFNNTFNAPIGAFQQGNQNVANVQQNFGSKTEEVINLLSELRNHISDERKQEGLDYIDGIEAEVISEKPSESRIRLFLNGLGETVKNTGKELLTELGKKIISGEIQL